MGTSSPEPSVVWPVLGRAVVIGAGVGMVGLAGGSLLLTGGRIATEAAALVVMIAAAIGAGIWAGAPDAHVEELPTRERWAVAGIGTALAGVVASAWMMYDVLGLGAAGRTLGLILLVALPTYGLGTGLPVLLAAGERWEGDVEEDGEPGRRVLGLVTLGAIGGVALGVLLAGSLLIPLISEGPTLLLMSVLLMIPLVLPEPDLEDEEEEEVVAEVVTPFSRLRVTEMRFPGERQPERRLFLNGEEESAESVRSGAPALAYIAAAESWLMTSTPPKSSFLFLGGGAYTLPRRIAERDPRASITVVELDPAVTQIARQYFGLRKEHCIHSVHGDARAFLSRSESSRYDRIYVDVYAGDESLPHSLVTREAFLEAQRSLSPGGVAAMNVIGVAAGAESARLWSVVRTWASVFPAVSLYSHLGPDYPDRQNLLLAGSADAAHHFPGRAGLFERWVAAEWATGPETTIYRDIMDDGPAS